MQGTYPGRVVQRLLQLLPVVVGMIAVTFSICRAGPGNPAVDVAGVAATERLPVQFWRYTTNLLRGDLGQSHRTGTPVLETLVRRLPASLELMCSGLLLAMFTAIPLGVVAALWPDSRIDHICRWSATAGEALPTILTVLLLIYLFDYHLGWAPTPRAPSSGLIDRLAAGHLGLFWRALQPLALPAVTLGMVAMAPLLRITRDAMTQVLASEFIRMARARGLSRRQVWWTYALRNAMLPVLSALGMVLSRLLGATILVEHGFGWPGIGAFVVEALAVSDGVVVQGVVLVMASLLVLLALGADMLYMWVDPRGHTDASLS